MPDPAHPTLAELDAMPAAAFEAALGDLFENSPSTIEGAARRRPFRTARALHDALMDRVRAAGAEDQLRLIRAHPELAGQEAASGVLTRESTGEQDRLGFTRLGRAEHAELAALNAAYRARFGFPCVVALCRYATRDSVLDAMRARLAAHPEAERTAAIAEIGQITAARLARRLGRAGGALSIHALDTARGGAAPDLAFALHRAEDGGWRRLTSLRTNAQGRSDGPLLAGLDFEPGAYRIDYQLGDYHRGQGVPVSDPAFLEVVSIAFGIADAGAHYHIPIQFTPWSYSTYRGS